MGYSWRATKERGRHFFSTGNRHLGEYWGIAQWEDMIGNIQDFLQTDVKCFSLNRYKSASAQDRSNLNIKCRYALTNKIKITTVYKHKSKCP